MEMSTPETIIRAKEPIRPLKRVEYQELGRLGFFQDEKVELLFGMVVPMSPVDPSHEESKEVLGELLRKRIADRARVRIASAFAASDISQPQPDLMIVPNQDYWREHPVKAFLIAEVARTSLRKDKGPKAVLYGLAEVDEYWIINHEDDVVEVYRDRHAGEWRWRSTHRRGEAITMQAFPDVAVAVSEILPPR